MDRASHGQEVTRLPSLIALALLLAGGASAQPADDIRAARDRAELSRRGLGVPLDHAAAARWYRKAAEQGDAGAQNALGALYASGLGVPQDHGAAFAWYRRAAEQGAPAHQFDLALMYDNGLGVAQDFSRAAEWYAKAAAQGLPDAEANLGFLYQQGAGVPQDFAKALDLYTRAARKGHAKAQNNLGLMYTRGEGVAQNYAVAVDWYRKAAAQGFAKAITNLAVMVENGFGVKQDEDEARRLYRLGGRHADASQAALDQARFLPDGKASDPPALAAAAARHDANAQFNLGLRYVRGLGVPQDYVLGYMWLNLSAAHGLADAIRLRDALGAKLTAAQVNEAQRLARERWTKN
jgi:TPR repeat protein